MLGVEQAAHPASPTGYSSGSRRRHSGIASGQRGWKRQPRVAEPGPGALRGSRPAPAWARDGRERVHQAAGVRMQGPSKIALGGGRLGDLARVHDHHAVGVAADDRHVVGHEDHGEPEASLELPDLGHQRALRDDVERRGRLVHDHELRREQQRHRDHRALAHAAAQLVGVALEVDRRRSRPAPGPPRSAAGSPPSTSVPCASSVSLNWAPMLFIGLSAFIALCITTE